LEARHDVDYELHSVSAAVLDAWNPWNHNSAAAANRTARLREQLLLWSNHRPDDVIIPAAIEDGEPLSFLPYLAVFLREEYVV